MTDWRTINCCECGKPFLTTRAATEPCDKCQAARDRLQSEHDLNPDAFRKLLTPIFKAMFGHKIGRITIARKGMRASVQIWGDDGSPMMTFEP